MWPDRESNPGPLALESDALPTELCGPADDTLIRNPDLCIGWALNAGKSSGNIVFYS